MTDQYTKEPWRHDYGCILSVYSQEDCGLVYEICKFPDTARGAADLIRTRACVNACAGIETEVLETISMPHAGATLMEVTEERNIAAIAIQEMVHLLANKYEPSMRPLIISKGKAALERLGMKS